MEEVVQLLDLCFKGWPHFDLSSTPIDHYRWKYEQNPMRARELHAWIATDNEKIISSTHSIHQKLKIDDEEYDVTNGADMGVHPDYRRMGIYNELKKIRRKGLIRDGIELHYAIASNPILLERIKRRGLPTFPRELHSYIRIQDLDVHLSMIKSENSGIIKLGYQLFKIINKLSQLFDRSHETNENVEVSMIEKFDNRIDDFWENIREDYSYIVERTRKYLNWRYCDPRGGNYIVNIAEEAGKILGYTVLRINKYDEEYPVGFIVDLITLRNRFDAANKLIKNAIEFFDNQKINIIRYMNIKDHFYQNLVNKNGFISRKLNIKIVYHNIINISEEIKKLNENPSNIMHYVYGDFDWI